MKGEVDAMRPDHYGPLIEQKLRRTRKGISKFEIRTALGCSEGRVRFWFEDNATRVECVGVNDHGAKLWKFREATRAELTRRHVLPPIKVGDKLSVGEVEYTARGMEIVLRDAKGVELTRALVEPRHEVSAA